MSFSDAETYAKRVRGQRTAEDKLDELGKAMAKLAEELGRMDRRIKNVEAIAAHIANNQR
jgi:hypothetical protein